jgi:hypothetical protein
MDKDVVFEDECEKLELVVTDGEDARVALEHHHGLDRGAWLDIIEIDRKWLPRLFQALAYHVDATTRLRAAGVFDETLAALQLMAAGPMREMPAPLRGLLRDLDSLVRRAENEQQQGGDK